MQHKGVQALATLDEKLEQTPLLQELDPNEMPDEVTDSNGNITQDCSEVWVWLKALAHLVYMLQASFASELSYAVLSLDTLLCCYQVPYYMFTCYMFYYASVEV